MTSICRFDTPAGPLVLLGNADALTGLYFADGRHPPLEGLPDEPALAPFAEARPQLGAYFAGRLRAFDLPLAPHGTAFQLRAWQALLDVPYGATRTYGEQAARLGTGPRAIGLANGSNPLSIVVPCHRLVAGSGALTGYGGGLHRKRFLLELERATITM